MAEDANVAEGERADVYAEYEPGNCTSNFAVSLLWLPLSQYLRHCCVHTGAIIELRSLIKEETMQIQWL